MPKHRRHTSLAPINVVSLKINGLVVCKSLNRQKRQIYIPYQEEFYVEPNSFQFQTVSQTKRQVRNTKNDYRILEDCMQNPNYTVNSEHFCPNDVSNFTIEKRYLLRGERYWCVSISNENNVFNSENRLEITYSSWDRLVSWFPLDSYIQETSAGSIGSNFHLGDRHTTVAVSVYTGKLSDITSVTVDGHSICDYFQPQVTAPPPPRSTTMIYTPQINPVQSGIYPIPNPAPPQYEEQNTQSEYRFYNDCMQRRGYTANSEHFCANDVSNFTIEKRYLARDERYWCVIINNENNVFNSENRLKITYSSQNRHVEWAPSDSYIQETSAGSIGSNFHLGARHTTVAVSVYTGKLLSDITSVTVDGHSICDYFQPQVTAPPPPRSTTMIYTPQINPVQSGSYPVPNPAPPQYEEQNTQSDKRFLHDCMQNPSYTPNSEHFCPNDVSNFTIEKRYLMRYERYWCVSISNENNVFNSENRLEITFIPHNAHFEWSPDSYISQNSVGSGQSKHFHLGARHTTVTVEANTSELPDITSVTVDGHSICDYFQPQVTAPPPPRSTTMIYTPQINPVQSGSYPVPNPAPPQYEEQNTQSDKRFLHDCMQNPSYTPNSEHFCPNDVSNFTIEKRYLMRYERYWCVSISNENNVFNSENRLEITFIPHNAHFEWSPDSYISQNSVGSGQSKHFHLGARHTTVTVEANTGELPDITSVTVDGHSICDYFQPQVTAASPPMKPQDKPSVNAKCGIKLPKSVLLISYSLDTNRGDWPWHAAIYKLQSETNRNYTCGGTLINRKTVITAAHCVLDSDKDSIIVELGRYDLSMATPGIQEFKVYEVKQHKSYNPETIENDIAILVLANYVQLTAYVNFICLPEPNITLVNQVGKTVGWGLNENNELQAELKEASFPVVDIIMCLSSNRQFFGQFLTSTNFCAGYLNNTNVARGDSGGGLVFQRDNHWILGGITSLGVALESTQQSDITQYAIFTDVTKFIDWIKSNT